DQGSNRQPQPATRAGNYGRHHHSGHRQTTRHPQNAPIGAGKKLLHGTCRIRGGAFGSLVHASLLAFMMVRIISVNPATQPRRRPANVIHDVLSQRSNAAPMARPTTTDAVRTSPKWL